MIKLYDYLHSEFSQFGQDGMILKLAELINPKKYFVEFGSSGNDWENGNTPNLRRYGWNGLLMDQNPNGGQYKVLNQKVSASNIENLLSENNVPKDFGFLSIDIDGQDYHVWDAIKQWKPDIVCIESNHVIGLDRSITVPRNDNFIWDANDYYGASRPALLKLGIEKGYSLVGICVIDMIFIKTEHAERIGFKDVNDLERLDVAKTYKWVTQFQREKINQMEWVTV